MISPFWKSVSAEPLPEQAITSRPGELYRTSHRATQCQRCLDSSVNDHKGSLGENLVNDVMKLDTLASTDVLNRDMDDNSLRIHFLRLLSFPGVVIALPGISTAVAESRRY